MGLSNGCSKGGAVSTGAMQCGRSRLMQMLRMPSYVERVRSVEAVKPVKSP